MSTDTPSTPAQDERISRIAGHIEAIIRLLGDDPTREGLVKTPVRAAKALAYITSGIGADAAQPLRDAMFTNEGSKIVTVRDIEFYSMCEHHVLPFYGTISIAYIPGDHIVGLSKIARVVDLCARQLQVQERFTAQVVRTISETLDCQGVMAVCHAHHMCMKMRGVEKQNSTTTTIDYTGRFATDSDLRRQTLATLTQKPI